MDADGEVVGLIEDGIGGILGAKTKIVGQNQIARRFHERAVSLAGKVRLVFQTGTPAAFRQIIRDRHRRTSDLAGQAKALC